MSESIKVNLVVSFYEINDCTDILDVSATVKMSFRMMKERLTRKIFIAKRCCENEIEMLGGIGGKR